MVKKHSAGENIRVVIRCRDLLPFESERGDKVLARLDLATNQVVVNHLVGDPDTYAFDAVYNNNFTQRDIFLQEVKPLADAVLQGYNATVFAYGQSGSGKTHTMTGKLYDREMWGMMPQVVDYLFAEMKKLTSQTKSFKVRVSYVELYNGKSRDLLAHKQVNLEIKENMSKNFYVKGAALPEVSSFEEAIKWFNAGTDRRQTASTDLNDTSSRSHALFSFQIEQLDFENDPITPVMMTSKINVVDLAGSEKLSRTNATGDTAKEGCNINLSLSALATVIDTIVKGGKHIPYRGSPLTMLLKDSLGGNAKTVMFANIGPSDKNTSETISTLRFALRAKQIQNKPIKNVDPKDARIQDLMDQIEELRRRLGNVDLNVEDDLRKRIEELEIENSDLRGDGNEQNNIELEERCRAMQAELEAKESATVASQRELQREVEQREMLELRLTDQANRMNDLRSVVMNFIKRACTDEQMREMQARMPAMAEEAGGGEAGSMTRDEDGGEHRSSKSKGGHHHHHGRHRHGGSKRDSRSKEDANSANSFSEGGNNNNSNSNNGLWSDKEIDFYLQGFLDMYTQWQRTVYTQSDMEKYAQRAVTELQQHAERQVAEAVHAKEEVQRQRDEESARRAGDQETISQLRVELSTLREENVGLREKITRDQEKVRAKLEKHAEEVKSLHEQLEGGRTALLEKDHDLNRMKRMLEDNGLQTSLHLHSLTGEANTDTGNYQTTFNNGVEGGEGDRVSQLARQLDEERRTRSALEGRVREVNVSLRRYGVCIPEGALSGSDSSSMASADTTAFVLAAADEKEIDGDALAQLQQQIRMKQRLAELTHQHQMRLDDMIRKYEYLKTGTVSPNHFAGGANGNLGNAPAGAGGVVDEATAMQIKELLKRKEEDIEQLHREKDETCDKLVRKLNRNERKIKELEGVLEEERAQMSEERAEVSKETAKLQSQNQQLALELETLRGQLDSAQEHLISVERAKDGEIDFVKSELESVNAQLDAMRSRAAAMGEVEASLERVQQQLARTEDALAEKTRSLENNRQMVKWSNSLLEQEKRKKEELEQELRQKELELRRRDESWQVELSEQINKQVAANNKRLQAQAEQFQEQIAEEQAKQRTLQKKLKNAKNSTGKAAQRYDEMILENEALRAQFEDLKVASMKLFLEKREAQRDLDSLRPTSNMRVRDL